MKRIIQYLFITFLFSWTMWGLQILGQEGTLPEWFQLFGMFGLFGPFVAFMILVKLEKKSYKIVFKSLFQKPPFWTILFSLIVPMGLSGIAYLSYVQFETGEIQPIGVTIISVLPIAFMILFVGGPIEEFGWRGFLLPEIRKKYPVWITVLILGFIHGLWHLPLHYLNGTVQQALPIYEFILVTVAMTSLYVFLYEYTKSLIPMILLHWFANLSSAIFPYYYNTEGRYTLFVLTVVLSFILFIILQMRKEKVLT